MNKTDKYFELRNKKLINSFRKRYRNLIKMLAKT